MLNQKPELGFNSEKVYSVKQNSFTGKDSEKLGIHHNARIHEQSGNKIKIERQNLEVLRVNPTASPERSFNQAQLRNGIKSQYVTRQHKEAYKDVISNLKATNVSLGFMKNDY